MEELYKQFNYPSFDKFKKILKLNNVIASNKEILDFIKTQTINELHKPTQKIKENYKFIIAFEPYEMLQIDLLDYSKYSRTNKGYKFILIAVDVFSRYAFAKPIKNKTPENVLDGFKLFNIKNINSVYSDSGNEYKGVFSKYLNEHNIISLKAEIGDHNSLGIIDRFSKTLKIMISKYMTANETTRYYDVLDDLLKAYNNTPHTALGDISPSNSFSGENYNLIKRINLEKLKHNKSIIKKNKIKVGDNVREKLKKKLFDKGYEITYSKNVYNVVAVNGDKVELNDGRTKRMSDLIVVNPNNNIPNTDERDRLQMENKINRRLMREGLNYPLG